MRTLLFTFPTNKLSNRVNAVPYTTSLLLGGPRTTVWNCRRLSELGHVDGEKLSELRHVDGENLIDLGLQVQIPNQA
jgi:hypothetical protein